MPMSLLSPNESRDFFDKLTPPRRGVRFVEKVVSKTKISFLGSPK